MNSPFIEIMLPIIMDILFLCLIIMMTVNFMPESEIKAFEESDNSSWITLKTASGITQCLSLEEYLVHVVAAELPPDFEKEAMKAQAVAARTYTLKVSLTGNKHPNNTLCTDSACCQAYLQDVSQSEENVRQAVTETAGEVILYKGQLIEAVYSACSGGATEAAVSVWQTDYPYLQTVSSPGEEDAYCFFDERMFSKDELESKLCLELPDEPNNWFQEITRSESGGIETLRIGDTVFHGTELRKILDLRSTVITIIPEQNGVRLQTKGYGHRVGMSQYGANAMARSGYSYQEILQHYYPGTYIEKTNAK